MASGSAVDFNVHIDNTDASDIVWLQILRPPGGYIIMSASATGWSSQVTASAATLSGGTIGNGGSLDFTLSAQSANPGTPAGNWTVLVSDSAGGSSPFACDGDLSIAVEGGEDLTPPVISGIRLTTLSASSATVVWQTNEPAYGAIQYGPTSAYGFDSVPENDLLTAHSITLQDLSSSTGYHFQVEADDEAGNIAFSSDNTFSTPAPGESSNNLTIPTGASVHTTVPLTPGKEKIPPVITISTKLEGYYSASPEISGVATDNDVLAKVEYSIDGGANWQGVDKAPGLGGKKVNFSFTPVIVDDGNYVIVARAIDAALNVSKSESQTLIIDTGPPVIGGVFLNAGAQELSPKNGGAIETVVGLEQRITLNSIGGSTEITLVSTKVDSTATQSFILSQSPETGLWSGLMSFADSGTFTVIAKAVDGAENNSEKQIGLFQVLPAGRVTSVADNSSVVGAIVTLYVLESSTNRWQIWDGTPYGQQNPQTTGKNGQFKLLAPSGEYYLQATGQGYKKALSKIFKLTQPTALTPDIALSGKIGFKIGRGGLYLPGHSAPINLALDKTLAVDQSTQAVPLPRFELPTTSGKTIRDVDLLGKPTLITLLTTWSPSAAEQLQILDELASSADLNVVPLFTLEPINRVKVFAALGGYKSDMMADKGGDLVTKLGANALPTHYLVNRKGIIKKVLTGVRTKDELFDQLTDLN